MNSKSLFLIPILLISISIQSQTLDTDSQRFTHQDTLRGSITPERAWWDLNYYHLDISVIQKQNLLKEKIQFGIQYLNLIKPFKLIYNPL